MKKILISMFLLIFGLCLAGCEQSHDNLIDLYVETFEVEQTKYEYVCKEYNIEFKQLYYVIDNYETYLHFYPLVSGKDIAPLDKESGEEMFRDKVIICYPRIVSGSRDFISVEYKYYESINKVEFNWINVKDGAYPDVEIAYCFDMVYVTKDIYNKISNDCGDGNHKWDEGVVDILSSLSNPPIIYTCLLCGVTKKEPTEWLEHSHNYIDGLCDCGEFDINWLNENFRISDEQILFKGSIDDEFNCDVIILTLKHTTTYIELSKRHFKLDEITDVVYISSTPPSHFYEPGNEDKLDNFNQIVFLYVDVETKEEIIELIKEIEKLPFVESAGPNSIEHGA